MNTAQLTIDFDNPPTPWAESAEREARNWTPEALARAWASQGDPDWWNTIPAYERRAWVGRWKHEQERLAAGLTVRNPEHVLAIAEAEYANALALAKLWAEDIRHAFLDGRPCPIKPAPNFRHILDWAFQLAAIPRQCMNPQPTP